MQKKMRVLLELAKKMRVLPRQLSNTAIYWMKSLCCIEEYPLFLLQKKMRVLPRLLSNTAIYWMKSLLHRGVPSFFFASQRSTLIFFCKLEEYPHFFLQILGVALSFFAIQGGGQFFFAFCKFTKFLQTEPIRAWSYPVRTHSELSLLTPILYCNQKELPL